MSSRQPRKRRRIAEISSPLTETTSAIAAADTEQVMKNLKDSGLLPKDTAEHVVASSSNSSQNTESQGKSVLETGTICSGQTSHCSTKTSTRELLEYITVLTNAALASSTQKTYKRAWMKFEVFSSEVMNCVPSLPLSVSIISLFIAYLFKLSFAPSTISTYLSAIGYVHKMLALPDNTQCFLVEKLVLGTYRLSAKFDIRLPITIPILNKLLLFIPSVVGSVYEQCLLKAMFLFAFSAFARIGELVVVKDIPKDHILQLEDITFQYSRNEAKEVTVCFKRFKHNIKEGPKSISFGHGFANVSAVTSLLNYLQVRPKMNGPLFCFATGQPITRSYFDRILHRCLKCCQLDSSRYKGHSFRIGAATTAAERGLSDAQIRNMGRWKSNAFRKYIRSCAL